MNINRPGWGFNGGNRPWGDHWYDNHVNWHNHGWYHGCWGGHWGNYWYTPLVYGSIGWGLGALSSGWGYNSGYAYSNPYYSTTDSYYDYSQPLTVANYAPADETASAPAPVETDATTAGYAKVDEALAAFRAGQYTEASAKIRQAIAQIPDDPALHEFSALCDFALGHYQSAAAVLNSVLASAPGMDWTTLSGLYGNIDDYQQQLNKLRQYAQSNPQDTAAQFVLAYQDLISGETAEATEALRAVVAAKPQDIVAKRMLDGLTRAAQASQTSETTPPVVAATENPAGTRVPPAPEPAAPEGPTTDLVGAWTAERDGAKFQLTINEDGGYTWSATPAGKPAVELQGTYAINGSQLVLESDKQGNLAAEVVSKDADHFAFIPTDSPPGDAGLLFSRSK